MNVKNPDMCDRHQVVDTNNGYQANAPYDMKIRCDIDKITQMKKGACALKREKYFRRIYSLPNRTWLKKKIIKE